MPGEQTPMLTSEEVALSTVRGPSSRPVVVVLDTNVIVSALLVPVGTQASILLLALRRDIALSVSPSVLAEYQEVLYRPRLKLQPRHIEAALGAIRKVANLVEPTVALSISTHESDNRFLECAEAAEADYVVTGQHEALSEDPQDRQNRHRPPVLGHPCRIGKLNRPY
jgi:putative PIN family toxin of toxin-antitoxin system